MFLSWMKGAIASATEVEVSSTNPLPTQEGAMTSAAALSQSDTVASAVGRQLVIFATVAGNVKVSMADGTTATFAVPVGTTILPWAVIRVWSTGTTATATYFNTL